MTGVRGLGLGNNTESYITIHLGRCVAGKENILVCRASPLFSYDATGKYGLKDDR